MTRFRAAATALAAGAALALGACAAGPDFRRPEPPHVERYTRAPAPGEAGASPGAPADAQQFVQGGALPRDWWRAFGSTELDALVEEALRANPTLQGAQATLKQARENVAVQRASFFPVIGAGASATRQRNPVDVLAPTLTSGAALFNLYTAQVAVTYALDLFGANRRATESAAALAEAARCQRDATYLTLAGNVVVTAIQDAGLRAQLTASLRTIAVGRDALAILERSRALGAASEADVAAQQAALAQLEASLPALELRLRTGRDLLAVLLGRLPAEAPLPQFELGSLTLPPEIPLGIPAELVRRRPDVQAAEAQLHAAAAELGVSVANLLPQVTLDAGIGSTATGTTQLFKSNTGFWSAGATLTQTLFAGGARWHQKRAAEAALDAAGAAYRAAVLTAFQNVADSLQALELDRDALAAARRSAQASERSFAIARRQLELGATSRLAFVAAEQALQQATLALAQAAASQYADTAALFQALGGGLEPAAR
jgi:NodT family efflux transporter outer membrane factor (OMF) lipoprotein